MEWGQHPVFWALYDNTPLGVSIHLIDSGVDTGPIVLQKSVELPSCVLTFRQAHTFLISAIESLFIDNTDYLLSSSRDALPQLLHQGTSHRASDLPSDFHGWDSDIIDEIARLKLSQPHDI